MYGYGYGHTVTVIRPEVYGRIPYTGRCSPLAAVLPPLPISFDPFCLKTIRSRHPMGSPPFPVIPLSTSATSQRPHQEREQQKREARQLREQRQDEFVLPFYVSGIV